MYGRVIKAHCVDQGTSLHQDAIKRRLCNQDAEEKAIERGELLILTITMPMAN